MVQRVIVRAVVFRRNTIARFTIAISNLYCSEKIEKVPMTVFSVNVFSVSSAFSPRLEHFQGSKLCIGNTTIDSDGIKQCTLVSLTRFCSS